MRIILHQAFGLRTYSVHSDDRDIGADLSTSQMTGHSALPKGWNADQARGDGELWAVKTHDPPPDNDKTIYIIRDGREAVLSYFNYLRTYTKQEVSLLEVIAGAVDFGGWSEHVLAWNPSEKGHPLLLRFEELVANPELHVRRISDFLDLDPTAASLPSFDDLHRANPKFFRSGRSSSWTSVFDQDTHSFFWLLHYEAMTKYGYTSQMPEVFQSWSAIREHDEATRSTEVLASLGTLAQRFVLLQSEQLRQRTHEVRSQRRRLERLESQMENHTRDMQELRLHLEQLRNSWSWRCTKPFRGLGALVKGLKR